MLSCYHRPPREGSGNEKAVMLLHGYGANARDLYDLAAFIDPSSDYTWYFPQAPHPLPAYFGDAAGVSANSDSYAWFPEDEEDRRLSMTGHYFDAIEVLDDSGLPSSAYLVIDMIERLYLRHTKIVIGGFSQGAIVSCEILLQMWSNNMRLPVGISILSGVLTASMRWKHLIDKHRETKAALPDHWQSHGRHDTTLDIQGARNLHNFLISAGSDGTLVEFDGGHSVPDTVIGKLSSRLKSWLG